MELIPISEKASSTGIPTVVITANNISGSQSPLIFPVLPYFVVPPKNLNEKKFNTEIDLSATILSFNNSTTDAGSITYHTRDECDIKETSADEFSKLFYLQDSTALVYCDSMSYTHIIFWKIQYCNFYCNSLAHHLCTM